MTERVSFPPLHDPSPGALEMRKQHLLSEITREAEALSGVRSIFLNRGAGANGTDDAARPWLRRPRLRLIAALGCVAVAASVAAGFILTGRESRPQTSTGFRQGDIFAGRGPQVTTHTGSMQGDLQGPTIQHPLAGASQVTLADASSALGSSLVLPSTALVQPSAAGPVWEAAAGSQATVAVTFPSQGLIIEYQRPAPYTDPEAAYQQLAEGLNASKVVDLNGTPALVIEQNSDQTGANFGVVAFELHGSEVRVMGHNDTSTLEQIAQSILDRSGS